MPRPPHVLLVGGGHATVAVVRRATGWIRRGALVTLLSDAPFLYYSGMVPELLGGVYRAEEARIDLERLCRTHGLVWREDRAVRIDPDARAVETAGGVRLEADLVALNVGTGTQAVPADAARVVPAKPMHGAAALLETVERGTARRIVVVGGGAAGVEVALNLSARRHARPTLALVEPADRLLPGFPAGMGARALTLLRARGVDVRLGARAVGADGAGVQLTDGARLEADAVFWAAGPAPPPVLLASPLPRDPRGLVRTSATLRVPGHPWLFAAGDCAAVTGYEDLARVGVHAVKQGPVLAENLARSLDALARGRYPEERTLRRFRPYPVAPLILSTGTREGWWTAGPVWLRGEAMLRLKHAVDLRWMRHYTPLPRFASLARQLHADAAETLPAEPRP